jgi:hypothetical protein
MEVLSDTVHTNYTRTHNDASYVISIGCIQCALVSELLAFPFDAKGAGNPTALCGGLQRLLRARRKRYAKIYLNI